MASPGRLRRMMEGPAAFDPARTRRIFVVAGPEHPAATLAPGLMARLTAVAPGARLAVVHRRNQGGPRARLAAQCL